MGDGEDGGVWAGRGNLARTLESARVVICVGPGGVGKTSTSAAIAMHGAMSGRRVLVLTIDPARRLANALGLPEIGNEERAVPASAFELAGREPPRGKMTAMMLDIKRTWDEVVTRHQPNPEERARLLNNRFYVTMSTALAGSQEYMAMEKLHELTLRADDPLELIVVDTPPAAHAVDFLEAPSRMIDALDNDATRWLLESFPAGGRAGRFFDAGSNFLIRTIGRFTGVETLRELAELLSCFQGMFEGFRDRAKAVRTILADARTHFVIVSAPRPAPIEDARAFRHRLAADRLNVGGVVLNRATPDPFTGARSHAPDALAAAVLAAGGTHDLVFRLEGAAEGASRAAVTESKAAIALAAELGSVPVCVVPELRRDVHDLSGLDELRRHLF